MAINNKIINIFGMCFATIVFLLHKKLFFLRINSYFNSIQVKKNIYNQIKSNVLIVLICHQVQYPKQYNMQETSTTEFASGGYSVVPTFPRSQIYVSSNSKSPQSDQKHKYTTHTKNSVKHFFLVLTVGKNYNVEDVKQCNGLFNCYNCTRPIMEQMYFYPTESAIYDTFICSPIPHCSPSCCLRTLNDLSNNGSMKELFYLFYGGDVICAPPRSLLFIPGGLSVEEYHSKCETNQVVDCQSKIIRFFIAPMYVSSSCVENFQLITDTRAFIEECKIQSKISVAPERTRDNNGLVVKELNALSLKDNRISNIFEIDPSSRAFGKRKKKRANLQNGPNPFADFVSK